MRSPQFVGGSLNSTTGNIDQSSAGLASGAPTPPPPAAPTTQLANVDVPKAPSIAGTLVKGVAGAAVPALTADLGTKLGAGQGLSDAVSGVGSDVASLGSKITGGLIPAGASTSAAPINSGIQAGTTSAGDLTASTPVTSTASDVASNSLGSTLGGAAAEGITTFGVDLATGQPLKQSAEAGAGAAVGFAIGNVILPGIGGFVGGALGSLFCHVAGTLVRMEDGTLKPVEQLKFPDRVFLGGEVVGHGEIWITNLFRYRGVVVNGQHAVFEGGRWLRVKDAATAVRIDVPKCAVAYPIVTEHHLMVLETHIAADVAETNEDTGAVARLAELNANSERNLRLVEVEERLEETLSTHDLGTMQTRVLDAGQVEQSAKNHNLFPENVRAEIVAARAISPLAK
ncbi:MAG TPA: hypothetical protein VHW95_07470 [Steroidobacteraceae bacterium]|nr:hypothetical protein [Steroidobacteraceae bacterium]